MTMTAVRKPQKLALGYRGRDQVALARPCAGDHKKLVRAAVYNTIVEHDETLKKLAKV